MRVAPPLGGLPGAHARPQPADEPIPAARGLQPVQRGPLSRRAALMSKLPGFPARARAPVSTALATLPRPLASSSQRLAPLLRALALLLTRLASISPRLASISSPRTLLLTPRAFISLARAFSLRQPAMATIAPALLTRPRDEGNCYRYQGTPPLASITGHQYQGTRPREQQMARRGPYSGRSHTIRPWHSSPSRATSASEAVSARVKPKATAAPWRISSSRPPAAAISRRSSPSRA